MRRLMSALGRAALAVWRGAVFVVGLGSVALLYVAVGLDRHVLPAIFSTLPPAYRKILVLLAGPIPRERQ
jgi:hypothetical protein